MHALYEEAHRDGTGWLLLVVAVTSALARAFGPEERRRARVPRLLAGFHVLLVGVVVLVGHGPVASGHGPGVVASEVRLSALLACAMSFLGAAGVLVFGGLLPRLGLAVPGILRDLVMAGGSFVAAFSIAHRLEFSLHGIIATSAVVTGVIGFSLQDVLGNVMGGLSLQLDRSVTVGDWVKLGDVSGRVTEIRWRHTVVATRNGDTVLVPNSVLTRSQLTVLGGAAAGGGSPEAAKTRRWVFFNVDFRFQPTEVIGAVEAALRDVPIPGVAPAPPASCVLMELGESWARYAVRYWLTDFVRDDPTDSEVRTRVYFALSRASIPLSMPAHAVFVTEDSANRRERKGQEEIERRRRVLSQIELFSHLGDELRDALVPHMRPAPFARGEVVHRQGAEAHWLYVLAEGEVEERVAKGRIEERVCRVAAPAVFGEMSLMTGTPRAVTVVALTDIECYRLDKDAFASAMQKPDVAEHVAQVIARRTVELSRAMEELDQEAGRRRLADTETDVLGRIRDWFGLKRPTG